MWQRITVPVTFVIVVVAAVTVAGCEPEQEGTPLEPAGSGQQEEPVPSKGDATPADENSEQQLHAASGRVESVDWENLQVTISHERVESLGWPKMTMPFTVADSSMFDGLEPGAEVEFTFREGEDGQYVLEEIRPE